jgi:hypothetical protein
MVVPLVRPPIKSSISREKSIRKETGLTRGVISGVTIRRAVTPAPLGVPADFPRRGLPCIGLGPEAFEALGRGRRDFDSPILRFESWRPSQPTRSLSGDFLNFAKSRHFRRLVARSLVSGEESRPSCAESLKSRGQSLRADFSISEICVGECPEIGCVFAETGSNPQRDVDARSRAF